ncbi:transcriptional regulator [Tumebacillus algifaecis]|uniref:Transcriptional regulator n=1 Tax=Tumebacillus algifaecis TaxID=1214604 RepID=A0A223CZ87_9BACL|nr:PLP-dependent aminotransferase family protein [Tumebacillus algifaecis]ASS74658.1 transcriptional regulator [Tumebacillus algifaecis]
MQRKTLYQTVYHRLRYQILSGDWPIGSKLPPERKLAEEWGVSRNTIVHAYADLETEELIYSRVGSGRYVQALPPPSALPRLHWKDSLPGGSALSAPSLMTELHALVGTRSALNFAFGEGGNHTRLKAQFAKGIDPLHILETSEADYLFPVQGLPELRSWIAEWMGCEQITEPSQVMITSGSQEALQMTTAILANPGDSIAVEMPTYFGALHLFQSLGLHLIPVPVDNEGMRIDVLEGILSRSRPRFIYTVPTFHNPTGTILSEARRQQLLALSEKHAIPIVEDDAYRHLHFNQEPPPPLKALDRQGNVIYINTFSKVLFPGLRLGWVAANRPFMERLTRYKELSISTNTFVQHALWSYLQKGAFQDHLQEARCHYQRQAAVMDEHLRQLIPKGISYMTPTGGFYYWVSLPEQVSPKELLQKAIEQNVVFATGDMFLPRETEQPFIRLCYSHETEAGIEQGMRILSSLL